VGTQLWSEDIKGIYRFGDIEAGGRIILNWLLETFYVEFEIGFKCSG
jgi:hypothetical protein